MPRKNIDVIIGPRASCHRFCRDSVRCLAATGCLLCWLAGCGGDSSANRSSGKPAEKSAATIDSDRDASIYRERLLANPSDYEALFMLANILASQDKKDEAIELLSEIPPNHPEAGLASLGVSADWCMELQKYADAEQRYRQILASYPDVNVARRKLAHLLNRQGRRHEAVQLIRELCLAGDVMQDELHALIVEADAMHDEPSANAVQDARLYLPIGELGKARIHFTEHRYLEAAETVEPLVQSGAALPAVTAFYGCAVAEAQDDARFEAWLAIVDEEAKKFPEYWSAIGTHLLAEGKFDEGIRALSEAVLLDPTDYRSTRRLVQAFRSRNETELIDRWVKRYEALLRVVTKSVRVAESQPPRGDDLISLADELNGLNRSLEAILWRSLAAVHQPTNPTALATLKLQMKTVLEQAKAFPAPDQILCGLDRNRYPLPPDTLAAGKPREAGKSASRSFPAPAAKFADISQEIDLTHRYRVAKEPREQAFTIYQFLGGGVAVIDYDLDGTSDLYFAQGAADPPAYESSESDHLYRTIRGSQKVRLANVSKLAGVREQRYSIGVTSGDWNQDGFPDVGIANIGVSALYINNGDGTFREKVMGEHASLTKMSSSLAMGDVTGDHLPDLYVTNYVDDPLIPAMPEVNALGQVLEAVSPFSYQPATDELWVHDGTENAVFKVMGDKSRDASTGLGVVIADFDGAVGNEIFVGNDGRANQLWIRDGSNDQWTDRAVPLGCAFGALGAPTGSMGIAIGDFDRTGTPDIHIANFYNEPVSLYLNRDGMFRDKNVKFGLDQASKPVLGFGSQAIDYSNDGWLDLVVANGHVENLEWKGEPYRQKMQLFANVVGRFELVNVEDPSSFWQLPHLGRGLATLDFNRDGRLDLVYTDLVGPSALLLNQTPSDNHFIGLKLIGTQSERDAIGAVVQVRADSDTWSAWVTAGDGYLCKNEPTLMFGIGEHQVIDEVQVTWPSGRIQKFEKLPADQFVLLTENEPAPYAESR